MTESSTSIDARLPKREILKKSGDIKTVLENGKRWEGHHLKFFYFKADQRQIGFLVPKRLGKANKRNRVKRWMREAYRKHKYEISDFWILMLAKNPPDQCNYRDIHRDLCNFIRKINMSGLQ